MAGIGLSPPHMELELDPEEDPPLDPSSDDSSEEGGEEVEDRDIPEESVKSCLLIVLLAGCGGALTERQDRSPLKKNSLVPS